MAINRGYCCLAAFLLVASVQLFADPPDGLALLRASKGELLQQLQALDGVNNPDAQLLLWQLGLNHRLTEDEIRYAARFLASTNGDIFSASAECVQQSEDDATLNLLRVYLDSPQMFRSFRAADILHQKGDAAGLHQLKEKLADHDTPPGARRDLARLLLDVNPRYLFPSYLDLLDDPNLWVRYNAINQLRELSGDSFGYDYEHTASNAPAVRALRSWYENHQASLPAARVQDLDRGLAGIGAGIEMDADGARVVNVSPGLGAASAGIRAGDLLVAANGHSTAGKILIEVVAYELRGEKGSTVDVTYVSHETGRTQTTTIVRAPLSRWQRRRE